MLSTLMIGVPALAAFIGPDVSSWQHPNGASINWVLVKAAGHSFAFVKATEDTTYTNPYFAADWKAIQAAGMDRGAYHFARPSSSPQSAVNQANYFISVVGHTQSPGDLPPALDLEVNGGLSTTDLVSWTQTFLSTVQALTGRVPIIYASPNFWRTSMGNSTAFTGYPLWLAQWAPSPSFPLPGGWTSWTFWQYTDAGTVPGIQGNVDVSQYCCDFGSLSALAFGSTTTPAPSRPPTSGTSLYAALLNGSGSGQVEVHALSQSSNYTQFVLHATTAFAPAPAADWRFFVASFRGDGQPDLFGVHLRNTGSGKVEVHVLSASSGYQTFVLHAATAMAVVPVGQYELRLAGFAGDHRADLYAIGLNGTGTGTVEVHVMSEDSNYAAWVLHSASAIPAPVSTDSWRFLIGDRAGSGDLIGVSHVATASGRTEVHALTRVSGYQSFSIHTATPLAYTSDSQLAFALGDHDNDGIPDIYGIAMNNTGTGQTEVHVLSGASSYNNWIEHTPTGLSPTNSTSWEFSTY
jgi:GH25 family lysozyme M1 (1,4-beta-N-acetylmuramidase)